MRLRQALLQLRHNRSTQLELHQLKLGLSVVIDEVTRTMCKHLD
jgi:hypothetical protein